MRSLAEEEAREKETARERKEPLRKFTVKCLEETVVKLDEFFKKHLKTWTPTPKDFY